MACHALAPGPEGATARDAMALLGAEATRRDTSLQQASALLLIQQAVRASPPPPSWPPPQRRDLVVLGIRHSKPVIATSMQRLDSRGAPRTCALQEQRRLRRERTETASRYPPLHPQLRAMRPAQVNDPPGHPWFKRNALTHLKMPHRPFPATSSMHALLQNRTIPTWRGNVRRYIYTHTNTDIKSLFILCVVLVHMYIYKHKHIYTQMF